ncbi:hypothetical protein BMS3Abin10_00811 [bacterium BMS3Abin10]|nr:hypothetical protein BMS3Abin10_00811 [bacterium BMS3Abin10]GBE38353.1 hypothetical protein BMS3Bbin08_00958 [bacterium BMS3Bbin08]
MADIGKLLTTFGIIITLSGGFLLIFRHTDVLFRVNPVKKVSRVGGFRPPIATDFLTSDFIEGFLLTG